MESGSSDPRVPDLRQAELALEQALNQACATKPATRADTGELIEIEKVLELATDAAKHAVSLRRRRRADSARRSARWAMGDAEAAASLGATHRTFTDARGVWWDVFAVYPETRGVTQTMLKGTFQEGWLCFDSGTEKRRLSPIPDDWRTVTDAELAQLAERAEVAASRRKRQQRKEPGSDDKLPSDYQSREQGRGTGASRRRPSLLQRRRPPGTP